MAKARLLAPWIGEERRSAIYHCVSRVVDRRYVMGDVEREQFVRYMRMYEAFCGVRILSYCVMSNHFHILVEVPPKMDESLSDEALVGRLGLIYGEEFVAIVGKQLRELAESDTEAGKVAHAALREQFTRRMWDLGLFVKTLKQRFTRWYNARNERVGTLWEARYKSVLVEDGHAARVMSAYIDLNPIRAGMVERPEEYRWCSYAEAVAGGGHGVLARRGIARMMEERDGSVDRVDSDSAYDGWSGFVTPEHYAWRGIAGRYRMILFEDGVEILRETRAGETGENRTVRKGFTQEEVGKELERGGKMSLAAVLRVKTSYFVDGGVIGGKEFVRGVVEKLRGGYLKEDRKSEGSRIHDFGRNFRGREKARDESGGKDKKGVGELWSMRRLQ